MEVYALLEKGGAELGGVREMRNLLRHWLMLAWWYSRYLGR